MLPEQLGIHARSLRAQEVAVPAEGQDAPKVLEPERPSAASLTTLTQYLAEHGAKVRETLAADGALLLRGFQVQSERDFEQVVLGVPGMRPIDEVFMSEAGRTVVENTRFVLHTNSLYKTGGTFELGGVHHENYYVPDVPRFIAFSCFTPSWRGGETGLVNTAKLYADLPASLRARLEAAPLWAGAWSVSTVAKRYQVSEELIERFCEEVGLPVELKDGRRSVVVFKPPVLQHPVTQERALAVNLSVELRGFDAKLKTHFRSDYAGAVWALHRLSWSRPRLEQLLNAAAESPRAAWDQLRASFQPPPKAPPPRVFGDRLSSLFSEDEVSEAARLARAHFVSFLWQRGDVLLVDNLKMAHAGMPGYGARTIRALISNPLALPWGKNLSGLYEPREAEETVGAKLQRFLHGGPALKATAS